MLDQLLKDLHKLANPEKGIFLQKFFKTGKGEYAEGDIFLGITVPEQRKIAIKYKNLNLHEVQKLLNSKIHEKRLVALLILIEKFRNTDEKLKKEIFEFYLKNTKNINNWDLVDLSAHAILGTYLLGRDRSIIYKLAASENLWERRIAVLTSFRFIKHKDFSDSLKLAEILINDKHDLIHKAVGWMLRVIGDQDLKTEEIFLKKYYKVMPRTMLRYAIEKFAEEKRKFYLKK